MSLWGAYTVFVVSSTVIGGGLGAIQSFADSKRLKRDLDIVDITTRAAFGTIVGGVCGIVAPAALPLILVAEGYEMLTKEEK